METIIKLEIEREGDEFTIFVDDDASDVCETKAEAYLWAARYLHQCGMGELQERIDNLEPIELDNAREFLVDDETGKILGVEKDTSLEPIKSDFGQFILKRSMGD